MLLVTMQGKGQAAFNISKAMQWYTMSIRYFFKEKKNKSLFNLLHFFLAVCGVFGPACFHFSSVF